ncbi:MAG TPA: CoA-binding protein [Edaphocola sp.]|nr:CoA-binding protein [Edaphocola sp.]
MEQISKKTLVIGASENPDRYSNKAIRMLQNFGHEVVAIGVKNGKVEDVEFGKEHLPFENIDTVTLYINPKLQVDYYQYILSLKPRRIIFNPGTENDDFAGLALLKGIEPVEACTLVLLSTHQY